MAVSGTSLSTLPSGALDAFAGQPQEFKRNGAGQTPPNGNDSAPTQLSSLGVVRYNLDEVKAQAQAVQNSSKSPDPDRFKTAVQGLVNSVNSLRGAATNEDPRAGQVLSQVDRAVTGENNANLSSLQNAGIERQSNGDLRLDQQRLRESLDRNREDTVSTINELASRLDKTESNPTPGNATSVPSRSSEGTETERSDAARVEARELAKRQPAAQQAAASTYSAHSAVTTYFNVASF